MSIAIVFELASPLDPPADLAGSSPTELLHEMLSKAIHEQDPAALQWLTDHVEDITGPAQA